MAYGGSTAVVDRSSEQDQEVPIRIGVRIASGTRPVEDDLRGWLNVVDGLTDTMQQGKVMASHGRLPR